MCVLFGHAALEFERDERGCPVAAFCKRCKFELARLKGVRAMPFEVRFNLTPDQIELKHALEQLIANRYKVAQDELNALPGGPSVYDVQRTRERLIRDTESLVNQITDIYRKAATVAVVDFDQSCFVNFPPTLPVEEEK